MESTQPQDEEMGQVKKGKEGNRNGGPEAQGEIDPLLHQR